MQHEYAWESICVCVLCLCLSRLLCLHMHIKYEVKSKYDRDGELTTVFTRFFVFLRDFFKTNYWVYKPFTLKCDNLQMIWPCTAYETLDFYVFWRRENAAPITWGSILQMQDWLHRPGSCPPLPQPCTGCSKQDDSGTQALDLAVTPAENSIF